MKKLLKLLSPKVADKVASMEKVKKIHEIFCKNDCIMLEFDTFMDAVTLFPMFSYIIVDGEIIVAAG
ncbi:hypothetical protein C5167_048791 [Papaver somniferum]|uniref:Uncharacterized protein n=1 Tax=Papaver somniferum TaxID=3469 RepID=A0A4Y7KMZ9_PAPSO|nr:hypothetical protein C5167_048791 [Papaver somniferum]